MNQDNLIKLKEDNHKSLYELGVTRENIVELKRKITKGEKISILSDTMFSAMFQNENRIKYSAKFLSYFVDVSYEDLLKNIKLSKNVSSNEKEYDKGTRCDYVARLGKTILGIEVNNNYNIEVMERNVEYAYKQYSEKIVRGGIKDKDGKSVYEYSQTIQFNLNNFSFKENDKIIDVYGIQNDAGLRLNNKIIFVQIYVPNLMKKCYTKSIESLDEREKYLYALVEQNISKLEKLGEDNIMKEYIKEAEEVCFDTGFGESYDKERALREQEYNYGLDDGIKEGIAQGSLDKSIEIAKNLLQSNVDISIILKSTGLSKEQIEELKN